MKNKELGNTIEANASIKRAYVDYLFSAFWRRPVGYIIAILYIAFLAIIFLIVPKVMKNEPLFIWNLSTFNIPIFTLFFISASCGALAVTIYRVSREDGTELSLSAKPLTKGSMVGLKTLVYLIIMFVVLAISIIIVALIKPIFGTYSATNTKGITDANYKGLLLSMLVGNAVSIFLFSGIAILVAMFGGQVVVMLTSIGISFLMVMLNFIYGYVVKTPSDVINDQYDSSITSINTYTINQYGQENIKPKQYATIGCYVNDYGEEMHHYDTYEYWKQAEVKAKANFVSYIDFGSQLASLYSGFGLEKNKDEDVKKLPIGENITYKYTFDKDSHVQTQTDLTNIPIACYAWEEYQGKYYPCVRVLGPGLDGAFSNWYLYCVALGMDFNSVCMLSSGQWGYSYPWDSTTSPIDCDLTLTIDKLFLTQEQQEEAKTYCEDYIKSWWYRDTYFDDVLKSSTSPTGIWQGGFAEQSIKDKFLSTAKLQLFFLMHGQQVQYNLLKSYLDTQYPSEGEHHFPFTTAQVVDAYRNDGEFRRAVAMVSAGLYGFKVGTYESKTLYSIINYQSISFVESYNNLYQYTSHSLYSTTALSAIWGSLALSLFIIAMIVYKKTDFK